MPGAEAESTRRNAPSPAATQRLRNDRAFRRYWTAHTISTAGSTISLVVLPVLMFQRTGSALPPSPAPSSWFSIRAVSVRCQRCSGGTG